ncbi:cbb3-type cytochrome oxidase assembly protein CcoS [Mesorhizobium sp. BAC0120]|uniref:cbb3-type cytochrome oxidase assembly protein CcoS n=1 Tax=Mesorhizobium sp. BAC0120 TaxID=3090670 RepID=UPI00298C8FC1|nr:cbb3-type cytochrome oxidase assembly protein CcoS [Mesorhizobium sp. BAC0120]MDW6024819.1 cbb3-type cytochrome oxidase assembly protein CcoS [Mesorhizobium sp. BAC0120]
MTNLVFLIPVALFLGGLGLGAFLWALRSGQYEDLDGAAERVLFDDPHLPDEPWQGSEGQRQPECATR